MNDNMIDRILNYALRGMLAVVGMLLMFLLFVFVSKNSILTMYIIGFIVFVLALGWFIREVIGL